MVERRSELIQHKIRFDEEQGILRLQVLDDFTPESIDEMFTKVKELFNGKEPKLILVDISKMPNLSLDKNTRKLLQEKAVPFDKMALLGATPITRMMAKVILTVLGKSASTYFCRTENEALSWLKGEE
ncbi:hypothetical protein GF338_09730 [candidate division WOR-3 bacterium]|nr:hypothetical protein [candidate division WOR-3 bacterium]